MAKDIPHNANQKQAGVDKADLETKTVQRVNVYCKISQGSIQQGHRNISVCIPNARAVNFVK